MARAVLRPRCWSGKKNTRGRRSQAHSSTSRAFEEVHTTPPRAPQKALSAAVEFMYVTGSSVSPCASASRAQASSTSPAAAMSAMGQPAARSGRMTLWCGARRMSAASAMKCTPQKTMNSASCWRAASRESLSESPRKSANSMTLSRW